MRKDESSNNEASIMDHDLLTMKGLSVDNEHSFKDNSFWYPIIWNVAGNQIRFLVSCLVKLGDNTLLSFALTLHKALGNSMYCSPTTSGFVPILLA